MKIKLSATMALLVAGAFFYQSPMKACTGITLKSQKDTTIVARTIEWGGSNLNSQYVIVPRGYTERSYTPDGIDGMSFTARYGYVGLAVEQKEFVAEGLNEAGLSAYSIFRIMANTKSMILLKKRKASLIYSLSLGY